MRSAVETARRQVISRCHVAASSHSTGAGAIIISAVALTAPTVSTTSAASAACRQRRACRGEHGEADEPAEPGPRQQHRRRARDVREEVRRQLVDERGGEGGGQAEAEAPAEPQHAGAGGEEQRADPQPVRHPVGQSDRVAEPVPRPLRPEVGDDLVRHPPGELAAVERPRCVGDEAARVEVQVELGVGRHPARRRPQGRHVGEQGERRHGRRRRQAPSVTASRDHVLLCGSSA